MLATDSHKLSHYIQLVKYSKSSCESDLKLENGNYDEELARENEEFTEEIFGMISKEYSEGESKGKEIN